MKFLVSERLWTKPEMLKGALRRRSVCREQALSQLDYLSAVGNAISGAFVILFPIMMRKIIAAKVSADFGF